MSLLERLFSIGPIRKAIWQMWYPFLTRRLRGEEVLFHNYAFETDPSVGLKLEAQDEPNRACIQLYHHVASQVDLRGREVLEVSCGHGGGASWITRTLLPASYTGLDLNPTGIAFCSQHHRVPGLVFKQGDAQCLPFADSSLDAVINVEASHCYPDFRAGTSLTAEIGLMRAGEQLSAMEMMAVDPVLRILAPRFWAGVITMPLLAAVFSAVGVIGGWSVGVLMIGIDPGAFWSQTQGGVDVWKDVGNGVLKSVVFGVAVTFVALLQGFTAKPTPEGVSRATTRTVVMACLAVLGLDFVLTALMFSI